MGGHNHNCKMSPAQDNFISHIIIILLLLPVLQWEYGEKGTLHAAPWKNAPKLQEWSHYSQRAAKKGQLYVPPFSTSLFKGQIFGCQLKRFKAFARLQDQ